MIVDPDFLDHWRTGMVADALGDPMAAIYILRLWAHCQERRSDTFSMPTRGLKAQCRFPGDADAFERALQEAGFIERDGDFITVCGWAEKNASLFAAWENGLKGGRPKKAANNPEETHGKPSDNPSLTQAKPIREEKSREDKKTEADASVRRATRKCPELFVITDEMREWAAAEAPGVNLDRETAKFRDHTFRSALTDWPGAWRNWIRRTSEDRKPAATFADRRTQQVRAFAPGIAARGDFIEGETNVLAIPSRGTPF